MVLQRIRDGLAIGIVVVALAACSSTTQNGGNGDSMADTSSDAGHDGHHTGDASDSSVDTDDNGGHHGGGNNGGSNGEPCVADYAGCSSYVDHTGDSVVEIDFGGVEGENFNPKCIQISAGTTVTWIGNFSTHPLTQQCGPAEDIIENGSGTSTKSIVFNDVGIFGYYCDHHVDDEELGTGMAGSIEVVP